MSDLWGLHTASDDDKYSLPALWADYQDWNGSHQDPKESVQYWKNIENYLTDRHDLPGADSHDETMRFDKLDDEGWDRYYSHPATFGMAKLHALAQDKHTFDGDDNLVPFGDDDLLQAAALGLTKIKRDQHNRVKLEDPYYAHWPTASTNGIRYAHVVEADVADDLRRLAMTPPGFRVLHHFTDPQSARGIRAKGFRAGVSPHHRNAVYFTTDPNSPTASGGALGPGITERIDLHVPEDLFKKDGTFVMPEEQGGGWLDDSFDTGEEHWAIPHTLINRKWIVPPDHTARLAMADTTKWHPLIRHDSEVAPLNAYHSATYSIAHPDDPSRIVAALDYSLYPANSPIKGQPHREAYVDALMVHPDYRGQGIAQALVERLARDYPRHRINPGKTTPQGNGFTNRMMGFGEERVVPGYRPRVVDDDGVADFEETMKGRIGSTRLAMPWPDWAPKVQGGCQGCDGTGDFGEYYIDHPDGSGKQPGDIMPGLNGRSVLHFYHDTGRDGQPELYVSGLHTDSKHRQDGVAESLMRHLHRSHPGTRINPGFMTEDGQAFHDRMLSKEPDAKGTLTPRFAMPWYHNTDAELNPGDELLPAAERGHDSKWKNVSDYDPNSVYFTKEDHDDWAEIDRGRNRYEVEPIGEVQQDPEHLRHLRDFEEENGRPWDAELDSEEDVMQNSYKAPRARVVRKLPPRNDQYDHPDHPDYEKFNRPVQLPPDHPAAQRIPIPFTASRTAMPTYYHVAPASSVDSIRQHGLDYTKGEPYPGLPGVYHGDVPGNYFWDNPDYAERYAAEREDWERENYGMDGGQEYHILPFTHDGPVQRDPENEYNHELAGRSFYTTDPIPPTAFRTAALTPRFAASVGEGLLSRLHGEFHDWWDQNKDDLFFPEANNNGQGPLGYWPNIESFLADRYPAAHKGHNMGKEETAPLIDGGGEGFHRVRNTDPYETGPEAVGTHGYDPKEVAAGMLLLHNRSHPNRSDLEEGDQDRLSEIAQIRSQQQRAYEQRNARTAAKDPYEVQQEALNHVVHLQHYIDNGTHPAIGGFDPGSTVAIHPAAHHPLLTNHWAAEVMSEQSPAGPFGPRVQSSTGEYARSIVDVAQHGPDHDAGGAGRRLEDSHNGLRVELQHAGHIIVPRVSDLSPLIRPADANRLSVVNPRLLYGMEGNTMAHHVGYQINCQRSVLALDARHRGHNVEARPNHYDPDDPNADDVWADDDIAMLWRDHNGHPAPWIDAEDHFQFTGKGPRLWDAMHDEIASWGPKGRAIVGVTGRDPTDPTKPFRHVIFAHGSTAGKVRFVDPQSADTDVSNWRDRIKYEGGENIFDTADRDRVAARTTHPIAQRMVRNFMFSPLRFLRTDNVELAPDASQHLVDRGTADARPIYPHDQPKFVRMSR